MGADSTQPGQGHSAPRAAHRPSGKPARVPALPALLEPGEPQPPALPLPCPGRGEIPQRPVQIPERLLIGALGILTPPRQRRISLLLRIPQFVQAGARVPPALNFVTLLALRQAPVPREPRRPRMRPQGTLLRRRRIQGEPVRLDNPHPATPSPGPPPNQLMHPPSQEHLTFPAPRTPPRTPPPRAPPHSAHPSQPERSTSYQTANSGHPAAGRNDSPAIGVRTPRNGSSSAWTIPGTDRPGQPRCRPGCRLKRPRGRYQGRWLRLSGRSARLPARRGAASSRRRSHGWPGAAGVPPGSACNLVAGG